MTFAASDADLPHPQVPGLTANTANNGADGGASSHQARDFTVDYNVEGMAVGYRWFQEKNRKPLFPFGFGLSYTQYRYSDLKLDPDGKSVSFQLRNTGAQAGDEIAEVYVTLPDSAAEPFRKLAGWKRVSLAPGASEQVEVPIDPLYLSTFSVEQDDWRKPDGEYLFEVGGASSELPLHDSLRLVR